MTKSRKFKKEYANELLQIAVGDLKSARGLHKIKEGRPENVLFLAEQAIEKALKAALCSLGIAVPLVHDLAVIINQFPEGESIPESENMTDLDQFATIRRYEEGRAIFSDEEINAVLALAGRTIDWVAKKV